MGDHEFDGAAAGPDDGTDEIASRPGSFACGHPDDVVERRQRFSSRYQDAVLVLDLGPQRLRDGGDVDLIELQRSEHRTESSGLHQLGVFGLVAGLLQK